jgi:hypothetical protein
MSTPYAIYDDFYARVAEIRKLDAYPAHLADFCAQLVKPEKLAVYFITESGRAVIEDRKRAQCYHFWCFSMLDALGLRVVDQIRGTFQLTDKLFWRQEDCPDAVIQVFSALYESLGSMGYIAHFLEIYNILTVDARSDRIAKTVRAKMLGPESPVRKLKDRIAITYCRVRKASDGSAKIDWINSNPFENLEPMPEPESQELAPKVSSSVYQLGGRSVTAALCKHGLLLVPGKGNTKLVCGMPADVRCDFTTDI